MDIYGKRIRIVLAFAMFLVALYSFFLLIDKSTQTLHNIPSRDIVNINTAGIDELTKLDGVGDFLAEAIILFREENGHFKEPEDIMKVKGIGETIFENNKKSIVV